MLKSYGWVMGGWTAILVSAQGPLVLGFGTKGFGNKGLGPGLDNVMIILSSRQQLL